MDTPKPPELKDSIVAANEVAKTARDVLTAMLVVAITMAATMIAATDEALLRDSTEIFPSLGVKIKLSTAYLLAPIIFVFLHANALLQLHLLGQRLRGIEEEMAASAMIEVDRARWRRTIHGFAFAQILLGRESHTESGLADALHRSLLAFVTWLAIVGVPLILLITAQVSFVRYQSGAITTAHQLAISADLLLLAGFHMSTWRCFTKRKWISACWSCVAATCVALVLCLSWLHAVPPKADDDVSAIQWDYAPEGAKTKPDSNNHLGHWFRQALWPALSGEANLLDRWAVTTAWLWSRRYLDLSKHILIENEAKPTLLEPFAREGMDKGAIQRQLLALDLRGRTFRFANFASAKLFSADLRKIDAEKSNWDGSILIGSNLSNSNLQNAQLTSVQLQKSDLIFANLKGANLGMAHIEGATLYGAQLQGANLFAAHLEGAELISAHLGGADLRGASLQGAALAGANLEAADLNFARLQGADLRNARVVGATLPGSVLITFNGAVGCNNVLILPTKQDVLYWTGLSSELLKIGLSQQIIERRYADPPGTCDGKPWADFLPQKMKLSESEAFAFAQVTIKFACDEPAATDIIYFRLGQMSPYKAMFMQEWNNATCPAVIAVRERTKSQSRP